MAHMTIEIYRSNSKTQLLELLSQNVFSSKGFFEKALVIVSSNSIKDWLLLQLARERRIAMGVEILSLDLALKRFYPNLPSYTEVSLALFSLLDGSNPIKRANELAQLFLRYIYYCPQKCNQWTREESSDPQKALFKAVFHHYQPFDELSELTIFPAVHLFGVHHLPPLAEQLLEKLPKVYSYLFSPCLYYWSDIRTAKESDRTLNYYEKRNAPVNQMEELSALLEETNPLLANWGKHGRALCDWLIDRHPHFEDAYSVTEEGASLLSKIKTDILLLQKPENEQLSYDDSIQVHMAPTRQREVEALYHSLLKRMDAGCQPREISILCSDLELYLPFIRSVFGSRSSLIPYRLASLSLIESSSLVKSFLDLLQLAYRRFDTLSVFRLLHSPHFRLKQQWSALDLETLSRFVEEARITWGYDRAHRIDVLKRSHFPADTVDPIGSWKEGFQLLYQSLSKEDALEIRSYEMNFKEGELLGEFQSLIESLHTDLQMLASEEKRSLPDWCLFLECLLETYLEPANEFEDKCQSLLIDQIRSLGTLPSFFGDQTYPFLPLLEHLDRKLSNCNSPHQEIDLQAVTIGTPDQLGALPKKIIACLGFDEELFPRKGRASCDDLLINAPASKRPPEISITDRYTFLEAFFSAEDYFILSYTYLSQEDGLTQNPSILIEELLNYLEHYGCSEKAVFKHPFYSFDSKYFLPESLLVNYSYEDYRIAAENATQKVAPKGSINRESLTEITVRDLIQAAKDPSALYLSKRHGIRIPYEIKPQFEDNDPEELSALDRFRLQRQMIDASLSKHMPEVKSAGLLPRGLIGTVNERKCMAQQQSIQGMLIEHSLKGLPLWTVELNPTYSRPEWIDTHRIGLPPLLISLESNRTLTIHGTIESICEKGLLILKGMTVERKMNFWPYYLLLTQIQHSLEELTGTPFQPDLIFIEKTVSFFPKPSLSKEEGAENLKRFALYTEECLAAPQPLHSKIVDKFKIDSPEQARHEIHKTLQSTHSKGGLAALTWIFGESPLYPDDLLIAMRERARELYPFLLKESKK